MAKMNKKTVFNPVSTKAPTSAPSVQSVAISDPVSIRTPDKVVSVAKTSSCACLTHQQIEQRAREIWRQKGCPSGQDEKNWREAETQLKRELGIR